MAVAPCARIETAMVRSRDGERNDRVRIGRWSRVEVKTDDEDLVIAKNRPLWRHRALKRSVQENKECLPRT